MRTVHLSFVVVALKGYILFAVKSYLNVSGVLEPFLIAESCSFLVSVILANSRLTPTSRGIVCARPGKLTTKTVVR